MASLGSGVAQGRQGGNRNYRYLAYGLLLDVEMFDPDSLNPGELFCYCLLKAMEKIRKIGTQDPTNKYQRYVC